MFLIFFLNIGHEVDKLRFALPFMDVYQYQKYHFKSFIQRILPSVYQLQILNSFTNLIILSSYIFLSSTHWFFNEAVPAVKR